MNNTIPFHSAPHAPQITVDVNILSMLKQAASCLSKMASENVYAVLIQSVAISGDAINSIWNIVGYTVLLCFSLFKTSSVTKSVLGAH